MTRIVWFGRFRCQFLNQSREDRFQCPISGSQSSHFQFPGQNHRCTHTHWDLDFGVVLFKIYELWDNLDRFDPDSLHTFRMNRSGSWRLGIHGKIDSRVSKLISRDLQLYVNFDTSKPSTETYNYTIHFDQYRWSSPLWSKYSLTVLVYDVGTFLYPMGYIVK